MSHVWEKNYPDDIVWNFNGESVPVHYLFDKSAEAFPDRLCTDFMGKTISYGQMATFVNSVCGALQARGLGKGDRIGICLPNTPYFIACYYGALKAGLSVVHFNPLYTTQEIKQQVADSGIQLMVTIDVTDIYDKVASVIGTGYLKNVVVCPLHGALPAVKSALYRVFKRRQIASFERDSFAVSWSAFLSENKGIKHVDIIPENDIALYQYTGGTTGVPKAAMLTHYAVMSNAKQVSMWLGDMGPEQQRMMAVLPFFHVFAMTAVMNMAIGLAAQIIMLPRFDLKQALSTISRTKPTLFPGVPTLFNAINHSEKTQEYDLSSIVYCISGGAPLPLEVKRNFENTTGCVVVEGYGLSEASPVVTCNPRHIDGKPGAIGLPLPGTLIEIRDLENHQKCVENGVRGEICVKGPQLMAGYHNRDIETDETLINGWLRTGDVGYMDDDGYIFLTDRLKEMILVSGYNVYPRLIEEALYSHTDVEEAIVIGIPHSQKGEVPKGYVKLKKGATISEEELMSFANDKLNAIEKLEGLECRQELPKTLIGKLSKKELIQEIKGKGK